MKTVLIIGAGCSGTLLAANLLRGVTNAPMRIVLVERTGRFGPGVAYGTQRPTHVLNVPAGRMSAWVDQPDDFVRWANERGQSLAAGTFAPRSLYGAYLSELLQRPTPGSAIIERVTDDATAIRVGRYADPTHAAAASRERRDGARPSRLAQGRLVDADYVVLALGNHASADPRIADSAFYGDARYVRDPWARGAIEHLARDGPVLLIGTGLTMIDVALDLSARGHRGELYAISPHGRLPAAHRDPAKAPPPHEAPAELAEWDGRVRNLLRIVREEVRRRNALGDDWRETINNLRPITAKLWKSLPAVEKSRFIRHLRSAWDVHRHRMPPQTAVAVSTMLRHGELRLLAGRLSSIRAADDGHAVSVRYRPRGGREDQTLSVASVINCTGPDCDYTRIADPLIQSLREQGLIRADKLRLGIETAADGALLDADGRRSSVLFTLGPPRRATLWESTAVPEIREQAAALARRLNLVAPA